MKWSLESYKHIIEMALKNDYKCLPFNSLVFEQETPTMFLRHDIDFSIDYALELAQLENSLGVNSTFYVLISSFSYNFLDHGNLSILKKIRGMGHEVGVHLDSRILIDHGLTKGAQIINSIYSLMPDIFNSKSFSMHNPVRDDLSFKINDYVNCYSLMHLKNWVYVSDSNRNFRGKDILELIENKENIQFLSHPIWWVNEKEEWIRVHADVIEERTKRSWEELRKESPDFFKGIVAGSKI